MEDKPDIKKLLDQADRFMKQSTWKDLAVIKACLCSMGIVIGSCLPAKHKKEIRAGASLVFAASYAYLMTKLANTAEDKDD